MRRFFSVNFFSQNFPGDFALNAFEAAFFVAVRSGPDKFGGMAVLILTGNRETRVSVLNVLKKDGRETGVSCSNSDELIEYLELRTNEESPVKLIVLDAELPDRSAGEVIREVRARPSHDKISVLVVSDECNEDLLSFDADDLILRPVNEVELSLRIRSLMRLRKAFADRKSLEKELKTALVNGERAGELLSTDEVTGIANRRKFNRFFELEWRRCFRYDWPVSVVLLGIDDFGPYLNEKGTTLANKILREIAQHFKEAVKRPGDLIARYEESQFAVALSETNLDGALHVARRLMRIMKELKIKNVPGASRDILTMSAGVAAADPKELYRSLRYTKKNELPAHQILVESAEAALCTAMFRGGDRILTPDQE